MASKKTTMCSTVMYIAAGILAILPVPETVASSDTFSVVGKRSVGCLPGFYYDTAIGGCEACITCGQGEVFNDDCYGTSGPGTCSPCGMGYYQTKESHSDVSCSTCRHCHHRVRISRCTRTENTVCGDCVSGYYERTLNSRKTCVRCPTKGNIPKPCRPKPTTTTVPPVPPTTTTLQPSTTPGVPTTISPKTTTNILSTTPLEMPPLPTSKPFSSTSISLDGLMTTAAMPMETEMTTPAAVDHLQRKKPTDSGSFYSYGIWVAIIVVLALLVVLLIGLFYNFSCKITSSSTGYISPGSDTQEHVNAHIEVSVGNDEAGNYGNIDDSNGENIAMIDLGNQPSDFADDSIGTPLSSSQISTPRDSFFADDNSSEVSFPVSIDLQDLSGNETEASIDDQRRSVIHVLDSNDSDRELLARICLKLDEQVSSDLFDAFKTYCLLSEKLEVRTTESATCFSNCVHSLIQQHNLTPEAVATFLRSFFKSKNQQRCLNIIQESFPCVSSGDGPYPVDVLPSNLPKGSQRDNCDWKYYWKIVNRLKKYGLLHSLKLKDIKSILVGIDSLLDTDIKGVGTLFAIAVAFNVKPEVAHSLKRYRSLENFLTMSNPDLAVEEFVRILTMHNRIAAVKEIYDKLRCDRTMEDLKSQTVNGQTFDESGFRRWNKL